MNKLLVVWWGHVLGERGSLSHPTVVSYSSLQGSILGADTVLLD
jgi:hypothetical protein